MAESVFQRLNNIKAPIQKKGHLVFVSWSDAWFEVCMIDPDTTFEWHTNEQGTLGFMDHFGGAWAHSSVTILGKTKSAWLPVMDHKHNAVPADRVNAADLNKTYQRAFVKAIAMHGLGLSVFRGEDLPDEKRDAERAKAPQNTKAPAIPQKRATPKYKKDLGELLSKAGIGKDDHPFEMIQCLSGADKVEGWGDVTKPIADKALQAIALSVTALAGSGHDPKDVLVFACANGWSLLKPADVNGLVKEYNDMIEATGGQNLPEEGEPPE